MSRALSLGSDPGPTAISNDGSTAYVGRLNSRHIAVVDLASFTSTSSISLGTDAAATPYAADALAVMSGSTLAVARSTIAATPQGAGIAIFDAGVMRPNVISPATRFDAVKFAGQWRVVATTAASLRSVVTSTLDANGATGSTAENGNLAGRIVDANTSSAWTSCGTQIDPTSLMLQSTIGGGACTTTADSANDRMYSVDTAAKHLTEWELTTGRLVAGRTMSTIDQCGHRRISRPCVRWHRRRRLTTPLSRRHPVRTLVTPRRLRP